jgi:Flp pilus assembly pilin Flp
MPSRAAPTASVRHVWRRFCRNGRGSAAVEFALVAPVFFALLFAIVETAIMFFAGQVLETVTQESARQVLTGQAQTAALTQGQFKSQIVCPSGSIVNVLFDCTNGIFIDVESYPSPTGAPCSTAANVVINSQIDANGNFINNMLYNPGGPGDIVKVSLYYQWPLYVTGLGYNIANMSGNRRLLAATAAFCNEPY